MKFGISLPKLGVFLKECDGNDTLREKLSPVIELLNSILVQDFETGVTRPSITSCFRVDSDEIHPSVWVPGAIQGFLTLLKPDNCEAVRQVHQYHISLFALIDKILVWNRSNHSDIGHIRAERAATLTSG